ncbi:ankyrin 2,3/unc44 [Reticulomyxa filosa]|uniref:Ankyrin 2,3/unc44 n=1 Tax=Reticulomyxa filosa TaxID=46433 RepID=X6MZ50_RETFI|nr:ankyrin 2,3/unc44 [Reticulomyxa filosa]|eukprot:ETO19320.1 ankyrin 2,3/unc44 [Reticulomyxa filosa]
MKRLLITFAQNHDWEGLKLALKRSTMGINETNTQMQTCLHFATAANEWAAAKLLIQNGAILDMQGNVSSPMHLLAASVNCSDEEVWKLYLDRVTDINTTNNLGFTVLMEAAKNSSTGLSTKRRLELILEHPVHGPRVNLMAKDYNGRTILHHVAERTGGLDSIEYLVNKGISVNETASAAHTPLMIAVDNNLPLNVQKLCELKANVDQKDSEGWTALHHAIGRGGFDECIRVLIEFKADITLKNNATQDVVQFAKLRGQVRLLPLLIGEETQQPPIVANPSNPNDPPAPAPVPVDVTMKKTPSDVLRIQACM